VSIGYQAVGWNRQKRLYDGLLGGGCALYLVLFVAVGAARDPHVTLETLVIRALGSLALLLLHVVLAIGPLCRLDSRFLPLLYNRRHLGVTMFLLAAAHGLFSLFQFHAQGDEHPLVSLFTANASYGSLPGFPFEVLGFLALAILFLMAATSHDFWLFNLTPRVWKGLHMLVYPAYGLVVGHVALGTLQVERDPLLEGVLVLGVGAVLALHLAAGWRERRCDRELAAGAGWVDVGPAQELRDGRARVVTLAGERVAVFRHGERVSAISNLCAHQNGPLGEGRIVDGCITCPWHGYQYRPEDGCSPPPFQERVPTYSVRIERGRVLVDPRPHRPGTRVEPARLVPESGGA
jgi:nitrite reductase/ring-hydroxylating ferredoxin subunit